MKSDLYIFNKILTELREKCLNHDGNAGEEKKDPFEIMVPENFWEDILKEEEE